MRHGDVFLTVERIAYGVDRLLDLIADREAVERHRPATRPDGARVIGTLAVHQFPDGTTFQLTICSRRAESSVARSVDPVIEQLLAMISSPPPQDATKMNDLGIEMIWHFAEPLPQELLFPWQGVPSPEPETSLNAHRSWILGVSVCETCSPWIAPGWDLELRKIRSILDLYALPRLILPEQGAADYREDFIALIALFAAKNQCLGPRDEELPQFFRSYCNRFFAREWKRRKLSEAEWYGVVDRVFQRLYCGEVGMGFTMPVFPDTFRAYIREAVRGQAANIAPRRPQIRPGRFPASIKDAATQLGVSHMTVRRWMSRLLYSAWTEQAWLAVSAKVLPKKRWRDLAADLQASGLGRDAARKRVERAKKGGLTPEEARRGNPSAQRKGKCTACGEGPVSGELHQGNFFCGECLKEKLGISDL